MIFQTILKRFIYFNLIFFLLTYINSSVGLYEKEKEKKKKTQIRFKHNITYQKEIRLIKKKKKVTLFIMAELVLVSKVEHHC